MSEPTRFDAFLRDIENDIKSSTDSNYLPKVAGVRSMINTLDQTLNGDRNVIIRFSKLFKDIVQTGNKHANSMIELCNYLENIGQIALEGTELDGTDVAASMCNISIAFRSHAAKLKHYMQNINGIMIYPLETFIRNDQKNDTRKAFERAIKEYEVRYEKLKSEKVRTVLENVNMTPSDYSAELSEQLVKERHRLQLEACNFMLKVNEFKTLRCSGILQNLIHLHSASVCHLRDCLNDSDCFDQLADSLNERISDIQQKQSKQKTQLEEMCEQLKVLLGGEVKRTWLKRRVCVDDGKLILYHLDESKPPSVFNLLVCQIKMQANATVSDTTSVSSETITNSLPSDASYKNRFDIVTNTRTYQFLAEDDREFEEWSNVLQNAQTEVFDQAMAGTLTDDSKSEQSISLYGGDGTSSFGKTPTSPANSETGSQKGISRNVSRQAKSTSVQSRNQLTADFKSLKSSLQASISLTLPGNDRCADCGQSDTEWVSVNLGVLICLDCCGVHRGLGVQLSRTQSLRIDQLPTLQLFIPRFIGNSLFNSVYEANLPKGTKLQRTDTTRHQCGQFIRAKYRDRQYVEPFDDQITNSDRRKQLLHAVQSGKLLELIQLFSVKQFDLMTPFEQDDLPASPPDNSDCPSPSLQMAGATALHVAVERLAAHCSNSNLTPVEEQPSSSSRQVDINHSITTISFLLQNSPSSSLLRVDAQGETALHWAVRLNCCDAVRLLLQAGGLPSPLINVTNKDGKTALDLCQLEEEDSAPTSTPKAIAIIDLLQLANACSTASKKQSIGSIGKRMSGISTSNPPVTAANRSMLQQAVDQLESVDWTWWMQSTTVKTESSEKTVDPRSPDANPLLTVSVGGDSCKNKDRQHDNSVSVDRRKSRNPFGDEEGDDDSLGGGGGGGGGVIRDDSNLSKSVEKSLTADTKSLLSSTSGSFGTLPRKNRLAPRPPLAKFESQQPAPSSYHLVPVEEPLSTLGNNRDQQAGNRLSTNPFDCLPLDHGKPKPSSGGSTTTSPPSGAARHALSQQRPPGLPMSPATKLRTHNSSLSPPSAVNANNHPIDVLLDVLMEDKGDGGGHSNNKPATSPPKVPPKPKQFDAATSLTGGGSVRRIIRRSSMASNPSPPLHVRYSLVGSGTIDSSASPSLPPPSVKTENAATTNRACNLMRAKSIAQSSGPSPKSGFLVQTLYDCQADHPDELSFKAGEVISVTSTSEAGGAWWVGFILNQPVRRGVFPSTYVERFASE